MVTSIFRNLFLRSIASTLAYTGPWGTKKWDYPLSSTKSGGSLSSDSLKPLKKASESLDLCKLSEI